MAYEIEKNVPIPESGGGDGGPLYPFGAMSVSDSLFCGPGGHGAQRPPRGGATKIAAAAHAYGKKHGWVFKTRNYPDGSVRVWRTK